jgi:GPH family glycoside/pentoside/hexuronide:cation symporter
MSQAVLTPGIEVAGAVAAKTPTEKLNYRIAIGWGLGGSIFSAVDFAKILLLSYLVDYVGVAAILAGGMIAVCKIYDALIDPLIGVVSDQTKSRWGRRRPYLFLGALSCGGAYFMMFHVPLFKAQWAIAAYVFASLIFYATAYALFSVPYKAMSAEITDDYHARSTLMSIGTVFFMIGAMVSTSTAPTLIGVFGGGRGGHEAMSLIMGISTCAIGLISFALTMGAPSRAPTASLPGAKVREIWSLIYKNRPFFILTLSSAFRGLAISFMNGSAVFYVRRVLGVGDIWLGKFFFLITAICILSLPAWVWISRKIGKRNAFLLGIIIYVPPQMSWFWATATEANWIFLLRTAMVAIGSGSMLAMGQSMLPDAIEYDRRKTGLNREGIYAGFTTTVEKATTAFGIALVGVALAITHYVKASDPHVVQPKSAIEGIYFCFAVCPSVLLVISGLVMLIYPLNEKYLKTMGGVETTVRVLEESSI